MASAIEWTQETWNPVTGCTKVSPGCRHCYAERFSERFRGVPGHPYEPGFDLTLRPERLSKPLGWKKPRRVFVNSMSDLFHEDVPDEFIDRVFVVMSLAQRHTFQVLTKRAERMREYCSSPETLGRIVADTAEVLDGIDNAVVAISHHEDGFQGIRWPHVWLGVSVEDQKRADERIPLLLETPAAVRFVSAEPLLGPVDFGEALDQIDWVIVGGESGPGARPMDPEWARFIREQCHASRIPFFMKQMAKKKPIPEDLMIREWPGDYMDGLAGGKEGE